MKGFEASVSKPFSLEGRHLFYPSLTREFFHPLHALHALHFLRRLETCSRQRGTGLQSAASANFWSWAVFTYKKTCKPPKDRRKQLLNL
jgi:hypothetical protein